MSYSIFPGVYLWKHTKPQSIYFVPVSPVPVYMSREHVFLFGFKVDFVSMAPTDEYLPSLSAEILVTFSWRDVKGGVFIRYWMGSLTPELWVRTWACRISLDAE